MIRSHPRATLGLAAATALALAGTAVVAQQVPRPVPGADPELPAVVDFGAPVGVVLGPPVDVSVFADDWSGRPWTTASGRFRLRGFPHASRGMHASVFFTRAGSYPLHVPVKAAMEEGERPREDPDLGTIALDALPAGMAGVAGVLVEVVTPEAPGYWGITRYLPGMVTLRPLDDPRRAPVVVDVTRDGHPGFAFRAALRPGRYQVQVRDQARLRVPGHEDGVVEVGEGSSLPLVIVLREAPFEEVRRVEWD